MTDNSPPTPIAWRPSAFGAYLRTLRWSTGMSPEAVCTALRARHITIPPPTVLDWEDGLAQPSPVEQVAILQVLRGSTLRAYALQQIDARAALALGAAVAEGDIGRAYQLIDWQIATGMVAARAGRPLPLPIEPPWSIQDA